MGAWQRAQRYERGDVVTFQGGSFIALIRNRRTEPLPGTSTLEWGLLAVPGETGPEGPEGRRGPRGAIGPDGPEGPRGRRGLEGPAGEEGPRGRRGVAGPEGPQGPAGVSNMNFVRGEVTRLTTQNYTNIIIATVNAPEDGHVWMNADFGVRFWMQGSHQNVTCMMNSSARNFNGASFKQIGTLPTSETLQHSGSITNLVPVTAGQNEFFFRCLRASSSSEMTEIWYPTLTLKFYAETTP
ncbi:MAG: hypothetical protein ACK4NW_12485 [Roseinatronobacter sp.]